MNLRGLANKAVTAVHPNTLVSIYRSTGYTVGAGAKQVPSYADPIEAKVQIQALDGNDLKQMEGVNVQGVLRTIILTGKLAGVIRQSGTGGDKVVLQDGSVWLAVKVLESWESWTKAAICMQPA